MNIWPDDEALAKLDPQQRGRAIALHLHAKADPKTWRASVDAIQDDVARAAAEEYLRDVVARTKNVVAAQRQKGKT